MSFECELDGPNLSVKFKKTMFKPGLNLAADETTAS